MSSLVMDEKEHLIHVLEEARRALRSGNQLKLQHLSDQTIHSSSIYQHTDYIVTAVIIYTLSKLLARKEKTRIKGWDKFVRKADGFFSLAIKSLAENNSEAFIGHLGRIKNAITNLSVVLKPYVEEVMRKASINKASKIYEHGISLSKTAELLGVTQWELADYIGQKNISDVNHNFTLNEKRRAQMAMEFFS
jgi:hypothetical protein